MAMLASSESYGSETVMSPPGRKRPDQLSRGKRAHAFADVVCLELVTSGFADHQTRLVSA
jgi:hypothetical protein